MLLHYRTITSLSLFNRFLPQQVLYFARHKEIYKIIRDYLFFFSYENSITSLYNTINCAIL